MTRTVKTKLSLSGIGIGIVLILLGFFYSNFLSSDAERYFSGSGREAAFWLLVGGSIIISAGVLVFARAVTE